MQKETKIKKLLMNMQAGGVILSGRMSELGISASLRQEYVQNGWLEPLGRGAYKRYRDEVKWYAGVYALQKQAKINLHIAGLTALEMLGLSHYLRFDEEGVYLFTPNKVKLPAWFRNYNWSRKIVQKQTSLFSEKYGIREIEYSHFMLMLSAPERAIMECLYLFFLNFINRDHMLQVLSGISNREQCKPINTKPILLH